MNRFWLDVEIEEEAANWSDAHGKVIVDGEEIEAPAVHIAELARSLLEPGKFSIFTCGCGDALCGYIDQRIAVTHHAGQVGWRFRDPVFFWRYGMAQDLTWEENIINWRRRSYQTKLVFDHVSMLDEMISAINWTLSNVDHGIPDDGQNYFVALTSRSKNASVAVRLGEEATHPPLVAAHKGLAHLKGRGDLHRLATPSLRQNG